MASGCIHLAVTNRIAEKLEVKDINRLRLGAVLPDAYAENRTTHDSHLKMMFSDEEKLTYDLSKFLELFRDKMQADDLYLGYYLHFTQEMADTFIGQATDICLKEIEALYRGERYIDEFQWAWKH